MPTFQASAHSREPSHERAQAIEDFPQGCTLVERIYWRPGNGVYSIIMGALIGLFLTGLIIRRTPEYLGKKIKPPEMMLLALYTLIGSVAVVTATAFAAVVQPGLAGLMTNSGSHGLTEILYAFASSMENNGQNFAGLSANSTFHTITTGLIMLLGRFGLTIPALALAEKLSRQGRRSMVPGTLRTDSILCYSLSSLGKHVSSMRCP